MFEQIKLKKDTLNTQVKTNETRDVCEAYMSPDQFAM